MQQRLFFRVTYYITRNNRIRAINYTTDGHNWLDDWAGRSTRLSWWKGPNRDELSLYRFAQTLY